MCALHYAYISRLSALCFGRHFQISSHEVIDKLTIGLFVYSKVKLGSKPSLEMFSLSSFVVYLAGKSRLMPHGM